MSCRFKGQHNLSLTVAAVSLLVFTLLAACSATPTALPPSAPSSSSGNQIAGGQDSPANANQSSADRMIIRTVAMTLVVADIDAALGDISQIATGMDGFVVSSQSNQSSGDRLGKMTLRVPNSRLDEAVGRIKSLAQRVPLASVDAKDVTDEYVDQDARLRNLRATETQYLEIMKSATTIEQTLAVQKSLSDVRDQIERTESRLQLLRRSVDMATIAIDLKTAAAGQPLTWGSFSLPGTVRQATQALVDVSLLLLTLAIWLIVLAPVWLPLYLLFKYWQRHRRVSRPAPPNTAA